MSKTKKFSAWHTYYIHGIEVKLSDSVSNINKQKYTFDIEARDH